MPAGLGRRAISIESTTEGWARDRQRVWILPCRWWTVHVDPRLHFSNRGGYGEIHRATSESGGWIASYTTSGRVAVVTLDAPSKQTTNAQPRPAMG